jgi:hypothetical protein
VLAIIAHQWRNTGVLPECKRPKVGNGWKADVSLDFSSLLWPYLGREKSLSVTSISPRSKSAAQVVAICFALGVLLELPTVIVAMISGGAGHGDYVAARVLFPASMLLTLIEGDTIGPLSIGVGLLQFPIYGVLLAWSLVRQNHLPVVVVASLHLIAAIACFAVTLPNFS